MTDYSTTVFVPKTTVPTRFQPQAVENDVRRRWEEVGPATTGSAFPYLLVDGPPYANGDIHIGHALNKILKDFVARVKRQRGYDVTFQPGWDCHGLPIEWAVEQDFRKQGREKTDVPAKEFRQACRAFAQQWVDRQRDQFKALGINADWDKPYLTMNPMTEGRIMSAFHDIARLGHVYRANKPVLWSYVEGTSMAEAETEDQEHDVPTIWVRFPVVSGPLVGMNLLVWTTTPWSLPGNAAVVFSDEIEYAVYEQDGRSYVVSRDAAPALFGDLEPTAMVTSQDLASSAVTSPFRDSVAVPVFAASFVKKGAGTGLVHLGPSHSMDDWLAWNEQFGDAEYPQPVGLDGRFKPEVPHFAGLPVVRSKKYGPVNDEIVTHLAALGLLHDSRSQKVTLPHSWRSGALLITIDTPQWFIDLSRFRNGDRTVDQIDFVPETGKRRLDSMLRQRPDWVVSRQRMWGTPIGLFVNRTTGRPLLDEGVLARTLGVVIAYGSEGWWDVDPSVMLGPDYSLDDYERVEDVLDVWFDSACVASFYADDADVVIEGSDQSKGWFQSSLIVSALRDNRAPFAKILTHGFVLDGQGYKMSKSKKNVVGPMQVAEKYGVDVLRLWALASDYTQDMRISEETLKVHAETHRKIRNTMRYLVGALSDFDSMTSVQLPLPVIERYALDRLQMFTHTLEQKVADMDFAGYVREVYRYCSEELSSFLFDVRKDVLYCDAPDSVQRQQYRWVLFSIMSALVRRVQPIMPFTADEMFFALHGCAATHLRVDLTPISPPQQTEFDFTELLALREEVNVVVENMRKEGAIKSTTEAVVVVRSEQWPEQLLEEVLIVSHVVVDPEIDDTFRVVLAADFGMSKCPRCWKYAPVQKEGDLCPRCEVVVTKTNDHK